MCWCWQFMLLTENYQNWCLSKLQLAKVGAFFETQCIWSKKVRCWSKNETNVAGWVVCAQCEAADLDFCGVLRRQLIMGCRNTFCDSHGFRYCIKGYRPSTYARIAELHWYGSDASAVCAFGKLHQAYYKRHIGRLRKRWMHCTCINGKCHNSS